MTDNNNKTCISWSGYNDGSNSLKIKNIDCESSTNHTGLDIYRYYDKASNEIFDDIDLLTGYLCEARAIHTINAYGRDVSLLFKRSGIYPIFKIF